MTSTSRRATDCVAACFCGTHIAFTLHYFQLCQPIGDITWNRLNKHLVNIMKKALLFVLLIAFSGCAHVEPSIMDQSKVYTDADVRKSPLQVSVHPKDKQHKQLTAYFHPFVVQQPTDDYGHLGDAFAMEFHNAWTEERLFPVQEFQPGTRYEGINVALRRAHARGADLLILGYVPYFYVGSTIDDSAVTIRLNIYAAKTGYLLWTMLQSARIEFKQPEDWIYFKHHTRLPTAPFNKIIRAIAKDMAIPLTAWLPDPDANYAFAETKEQMQAALDPQPEPMEQNLTEEPRRPMQKGINLDILFDYDKATITEESLPLLDSLAMALGSPELAGKKIIIAGHTDSQGSSAYNLDLSRRRAAAVKSYLVDKKGFDPALIETAGYGKSKPLTPETSKADMQRNRRVEIRLAD